jgi:DNA-binding MarR family transcriptional regulator
LDWQAGSHYSPIMPTKVNTTVLASELRVVLGQLMRRLRAEHGFSLSQGAVLGRLDREGPGSVSDLAAGERVRPQSMAQTVTDLEAEGLVARTPDPADGRRALVQLTDAGRSTLAADRLKREGWLAESIAEGLSAGEQDVLARAVPLLRRLVDR